MGHCITRHQQEVQEDTAKYAKNDTTNSDADETKLHALIGNDPENLISPASSAYYEFIDHKSWKRQAMYSKDFETLVTTDKRPIIREPQECKVMMTNCTQVPLYLCWVDYDGMLLHHQPVHPPGYIQDGSSESRVCHFSQAGHAFCFYVLPDCATSKPNRHELTLVESTSDSDASADHRHAEAYKMPLLHHIHDIPLENFVCAYRPLQFLEARDGQSGPADATLATPSHELTARADPSARHASDIKVEIHVHMPSPDHSIQTLALRDVKYASTTCAGFQVFHEIGQFATISEREFTSPTYSEARQTQRYKPAYALYALHDDLCRISQLLPPHALQLLQARTAVYLNMQRLPDCPETAHTCYHPTGSKVSQNLLFRLFFVYIAVR